MTKKSAYEVSQITKVVYSVKFLVDSHSLSCAFVCCEILGFFVCRFTNFILLFHINVWVEIKTSLFVFSAKKNATQQ